MNPAIHCIFSKRTILGESPLWGPRENVLYWVDIEKPALHRLDPASGQHRQWPMPAEIGSIGLHAKGGLIAALRYGFAHVRLPDGTITMIDTPITQAHGVIFNDGKCDRAGRFWAGTKDVRERDGIASLFQLDTHGQSQEVEHGFTVTNGIAWSPDNTRFYVCNSPARVIYQYDFDLAGGTLRNRQVFATLTEDGGYPDGLTVDSEGGIWNAQWDGWCVTRYLPDGCIDRVIDLPVQRPTSCCFGGPDLTTLYITSASTRLTPIELARNPQAGYVFSVETGIKGIREPEYAG
jgi:sugar lactone lactonase YvrE